MPCIFKMCIISQLEIFNFELTTFYIYIYCVQFVCSPLPPHGRFAAVHSSGRRAGLFVATPPPPGGSSRQMAAKKGAAGSKWAVNHPPPPK